MKGESMNYGTVKIKNGTELIKNLSKAIKDDKDSGEYWVPTEALVSRLKGRLYRLRRVAARHGLMVDATASKTPMHRLFLRCRVYDNRKHAVVHLTPYSAIVPNKWIGIRSDAILRHCGFSQQKAVTE